MIRLQTPLFFLLGASLGLAWNTSLHAEAPAAPNTQKPQTAVVVEVTGKVTRLLSNKKEIPLRPDDRIGLTDKIKSYPNSAVKVRLPDMSVLSLYEKTIISLAEYQSKETPTVSLEMGTLRSKINTNYASSLDKSSKIKFLVKTGTAVMGVRGTEFLAVYSPKTKNSVLVTFQGEVWFSKARGLSTSPQKLVSLLTSNSAGVQVVKAAQTAFATPALATATAPTTLNNTQFLALQKSDPIVQPSTTSSPSSSASGHFSSILPPGVNPKAFAPDATPSTPSGASPASSSQAAPSAVLIGGPAPASVDQPEGGVNAKTGVVTPAAGGYVDLSSATYVAPSSSSSFDKTTGTYTPSASVGSVNPQTGIFTPATPSPSTATGAPTATEPTSTTSAATLTVAPATVAPAKASTGPDQAPLVAASPVVTSPVAPPVAANPPSTPGSTAASTLTATGTAGVKSPAVAPAKPPASTPSSTPTSTPASTSPAPNNPSPPSPAATTPTTTSPTAPIITTPGTSPVSPTVTQPTAPSTSTSTGSTSITTSGSSAVGSTGNQLSVSAGGQSATLTTSPSNTSITVNGSTTVTNTPTGTLTLPGVSRTTKH